MAQDETGKKIEELQVLENQLQNFLAQKQTIQVEMNEVENALAELKDTEDEVYKMTSGFLIKSKKENIEKELAEKKKVFKMRMDSIEKQEKLIDKDVSKLREEVNKSVSSQK